MSSNQLNFLKFQPIIKDKVWGGSKLRDQLHKNAGNQSGESWELSGVPGSVSIVSEGPLEGQSLQQLLETYKGDLVGKRVFEQFGLEFPLLFKFIDEIC